MDFWSRRPISVNLVGAALFVGAWLMLAYLAFGIVALGAGSGIISSLAAEVWRYPAIFLALVPATLLITFIHDKMPAAWSGLGWHRWALRELALGLGLGAGMAALAWAPAAMMNGTIPGDGWRVDDLWYWLIPMAVNAAGEELLFRGYLFQRGVELIGPVAATLLASLLFALAHLGTPHVTPMAIIIIFLGGIFFSLAYLRTGSLWLPIGAHLAWNIMLAKVLGLPVSGREYGGSLLVTPAGGPDLLTGGAYGPESGLIGMAALAIGIIALMAIPAITYSPYVHATLFRAIYRRQRSPGSASARSGG